MGKQTFTAGQVLTAAEMNSLQENDYNWTVTTKTASYTLAAGDEGTRVVMNNAGATTITVDDAIFSAGDVVWLHNIGAGTCTVTAGTATVTTIGNLALEQYAGGHLYFTSASAAIFFPTAQSLPGKILQVVRATDTADFTTNSTSAVDVTGVSVTITPTSATSSIMLVLTARAWVNNGTNNEMRSNVLITDSSNNVISGAELTTYGTNNITGTGTKTVHQASPLAIGWATPATTSATTYKARAYVSSGFSVINFGGAGQATQIFAIEVSA